MSGIQNAAKPLLIPLIEGRRTALSTSAQKTIAAWCTMVTMTGDYLSRDITAVGVSQAERDWFRDHLTPPSNWKIWIGHYPRTRGIWNHYVVPLGVKNILGAANDGFANPYTQTTTFVVGNLCVHVLSGDSDIVSRWVWPIGSRLSIHLPQIFPPKEGFIAWPPQGLADFEVKLIEDALKVVIDGAKRSPIGPGTS